jgi:hypothetical protein
MINIEKEIFDNKSPREVIEINNLDSTPITLFPSTD